MRTLRYGSPEWQAFRAGLPRGASRSAERTRAVARIVARVRREGDRALVALTARFDRVRLDPARLVAGAAEVRSCAEQADSRVVAALRQMARRIEAFHRGQKGRGFEVRWRDGSRLSEVVRPLDSAGLYVPGGAGAYPSSVLMTAIPARVAGVPRLVVATPPQTLETNPALAAALVLLGLEGSVLRVGGAQAIAALAHGTESIAPVARIVGPGNAWVAEAKRQVREVCETGAEAGPSEVAILADDSADPGEVAIDLLAQAEHGSGEEMAVLLTPSKALAAAVVQRVADLLRAVANPAATRRALRRHGAVVLVPNLERGAEAVNRLAPEHVEVVCRGARDLARRIVAGAVFVGRFSPVAVGDYGAGPNHVLPTGGTARSASALSVRDFERRHSVVELSEAGHRRVAMGMARVAQVEGFAAHAASLKMRLP